MRIHRRWIPTRFASWNTRRLLLGQGQTLPSTCPSYLATSSTKRALSSTAFPDGDGVNTYDTLPSDISALVQEFANKEQTSISLQRLMKTGRGELLEKDYKTPAFMGRLGQRLAMERILIQVAGFLQSELPIRLAHRIQDLDQVPMMRDMPSVQVVKGIYIHSFLELVEHSPSPIVTIEDEAEFCHLLQSLYKKHSNVLMQMAKGAYELRNAVREGHVQGDTTGDGVVETFVQMEDCHLFLDRFYMSRVGIRVLAGQYLALREQAQEDYLPSHLQNYIGMIKKDTSPYDIVKQTIHDATRMCIYKYGDAPRVNVMGRLDLTFPYIPTHVHYILLELLKNAMRATMEHWQNDLMNLPPVTVIIADGTENEDVVIKIMDEGGGIPRSQVDKIWSYLFTTASPSVQEAFIGQKQRQDHLYTSTSPIAGLGYGAPMSRAYARYFGGDLDVISMEGYGTDAFCYLARLGDKAPLTV